MNNCGCNSGRAGWHQNWRAPLRNALDWLRDQMVPLFRITRTRIRARPVGSTQRLHYVILDRSPKNLEKFLCGTAPANSTITRK